MKTFTALTILLGVCLATQAHHIGSKNDCDTQLIQTQVQQVVQDLLILSQGIEDDVTALINGLVKCARNPFTAVNCVVKTLQTEQTDVVEEIQTWLVNEKPLLQKLLNEVLQCLNKETLQRSIDFVLHY